MLVTLDTNVLYQAFRSPNGPAGVIVDLIRSDILLLALSVPVVEEYEDVLMRPSTLDDCRATHDDADELIALVCEVGIEFDIYFLFRPNLADEADNMFVELALTSNSNFLITNNVRDFLKNSNLRFDDLNVITPVNFLRQWRRTNE